MDGGITRTKYLNKIQQNIKATKKINELKINPVKPVNNLNRSLVGSQSVRSISNRGGRPINFHPQGFEDGESLISSIQDVSMLHALGHDSTSQQHSELNGRQQRLFRKRLGNDQQQESRNQVETHETKRNQRSLSRSLSEKRMPTYGHLENKLTDDMNRTSHQPFLSFKNIHKGQEFQESSLTDERTPSHIIRMQNQTMQTMPNIKTMVQQKTPSSSSNPSKYEDGETFQDFMNDYKEGSSAAASPERIDKSELCQFDGIACNRNIELDVILQFLITEEEKLNCFQQMVSQGQLIELQQQLPSDYQFQYLDLIQSVDCKKERPKYFAQQLQVTIIFSNTLVQVFTPTYLQRFSHKLRNVFMNVHQNFLLFIDQILNCCNVNPKENLNYILLRKLIVKKLKNKLKSKRITLFRQNNEVNLLIIKKICKSILTVNQQQQLSANNDPYQQEYRQIANEILELHRHYDRLKISTIVERLAYFKDDIMMKQHQSKSNQVVPGSPSRRPKTSYKAASPRSGSPRTFTQAQGQYSPAHSNKSNRSSSRNSDTSAKHKPKRIKLVKPVATFEYQQRQQQQQLHMKSQQPVTSAQKRTSPRNYDVIEDYQKQRQEESKQNTAIHQQQQQQQQLNVNGANTSVFFLPESVAFLLSNSIECNNGITNINNNINIYNTGPQGLDLEKLRAQAQTSQGLQKIADRSSPKKTPQIPFVKRSAYNPARQHELTQKSASVVSPKKSMSKPKTAVSSTGIGSGVKNYSRQIQSRQQMSRDNSKLDISTNPHQQSVMLQNADLDDLILRQLESSTTLVSRQTSMQSQVPTVKGKGMKSANTSPIKRPNLAQNRPVSRLGSGKSMLANAKTKLDQDVNETSKMNKSTISTRPKSRQVTASTKVSTKQVPITDPINVTYTPQKHLRSSGNSNIDYITNTSISLASEKNFKSQGQVKKQAISVNVSATKKSKPPLIVAKEVKPFQLPKKVIQLVSQSPGNTKKGTNQQQKPIVKRAKKESQIFNEQVQMQKLNLIGFEVNSSIDSNDRDRFYSEQKQTLKTLTDFQPHSVQNISSTQFSPNDASDNEDDDIFRQNESRLDNLLHKMNQDMQGQKTSSNTAFSHQQQLYHERKNKIEEIQQQQQQKQQWLQVSRNADDDIKQTVKTLQFGNLIEQHMGSLDLKREMEKLKQLDEDQKRQKKISLKLSNPSSHTVGNNSQTGSPSHMQDSPTKRILLGEFDEGKEEEDLLYMGDELLLSHDSDKPIHDKHKDIDGEIYDFQDYITQKTGMEDPFVDQDEPLSKVHTSQQQNVKEDNQKSRDDEENQRLRALVKIPYLPPLDNPQSNVYTLVLDLDETLIHFECDEDEQDEDEQGYYLIRPGAIKFLNELSKYYELVVFTAAMPDYADWILDNVDRHRIIKHRLYRQHTTPHEDYAIKDLRNLGRALERTIIIDNLAENFIHTTPDNGIWVESWYDDMDDTVLEQLIPFLKEIVIDQVPDVRRLLTKRNKEKIIYRCLEENKEIPPVSEMLSASPSSPYKKMWNLDKETID